MASHCVAGNVDDNGMTTLKLGKLAPDPSKPALLLGPHLRQVHAPTQSDWLSKVTDWPMYGNDLYGSCVFAAIGHMIEAWTAYNGHQVQVTTADVLHAYSSVTGFDPADPSTDRGTVVQDALGFWKKTGIAGHKILAFAKVDHNDPNEIKAASDVFGALMVGIRFPRIAMDQFNAGEPWDVVTSDGGIDGGHAIHLGAFDPAKYNVVTWGKVQAMTSAFAAAYVDEVWAVITPEWYSAAGASPQGLDLHGLGQALHDITGETNPFPPGSPDPTPADADHAFAAALRRGGWATNRHVGYNAAVADAARIWLRARGL